MLDKKDITQIRDLIAESLADFFHGTLGPYLEEKFKENDEDHEKIFRTLERNRDEHDEMFQRLDRIEKGVADHGKRIKRLETVIAS